LRDVLDVGGTDVAVAQRALREIDAGEVGQREVVEVERPRQPGEEIDRLPAVVLGLVRIVADEVEVPEYPMAGEDPAGLDDLLVRRLALVAVAADALGAGLDAHGGRPETRVAHEANARVVDHAREGPD